MGCSGRDCPHLGLLFSLRERNLKGGPELEDIYLVALDMSSNEDDSSSRCRFLMSSGASQSFGPGTSVFILYLYITMFCSNPGFLTMEVLLSCAKSCLAIYQCVLQKGSSLVIVGLRFLSIL